MKVFILFISVVLISKNCFSNEKTCLNLLTSVIGDQKIQQNRIVKDTSKVKKKSKIHLSIKKWKLNDISDEVLKTLEKRIESTPAFLAQVEKNEEVLYNYLLFLNSQNLKKQLELAELIEKIYSKDIRSNHKLLNKLNKHELKIQKFSKKKLVKIKADVEKKNPKLKPNEVEKIALKEHQNFMHEYQRVYYGCKAPKMTPERKAAAKSFKKFTLGIGALSSVGAYSYQNWDQEKNEKWFGKIGYEIGWGLVTGFLGSKIISNPGYSVVGKALRKYLLSRTTGLVDMGVYGYLFSSDYDKAKAQAEEILKDPAKKEEVLKLKKYLDENNIYQKFQSALFDDYNKLSSSKVFTNFNLMNDSKNNSNNSDNANSLKNDTITDLDIEAVTIAVMSKVYDETKGPLINMGHIGADRYVFHAGYGLLLLPKDTFISLTIYNILCLGQQNPKKALIQALALYTIDRVIFDQLYYYARRQAINM